MSLLCIQWAPISNSAGVLLAGEVDGAAEVIHPAGGLAMLAPVQPKTVTVAPVVADPEHSEAAAGSAVPAPKQPVVDDTPGLATVLPHGSATSDANLGAPATQGDPLPSMNAILQHILPVVHHGHM